MNLDTLVTELRENLGWPTVRHERHEWQLPPSTCMHFTNVFRICPEQDGWPSIDFVFGDNVEYLQCLNFSNWHAHYESYDDESLNIKEAMDAAKLFVDQVSCLIEELDEGGNYLGGSGVRVGALPGTISRKATRLRRVLFNREPEILAIDYSKYHEGQHSYVELGTKAETEKQLMDLGMEPPEW